MTVRLHTSNAITFVTDGTVIDSNPQDCTLNGNVTSTNVRWCPALFGYGIKEMVISGPSSITPVLGEVYVQQKFINPYPGAPLPDSYNLARNPLPNQYPEFASLTSTSFGPLRLNFGVPEGTPGKASTVQTGLFANPGIPNQIIDDGFPVENVSLKVVGNGTQ